ncbi:MAG TPA: hypothetical protein VL330_27500 [Actinomycetes bacterium]|nr:hypothetical protein [Actinomycetes bacterium]
MRVLAHDPFSPPPPEVDTPDLGTLAAASDVDTLHSSNWPTTSPGRRRVAANRRSTPASPSRIRTAETCEGSPANRRMALTQ